MPRTCVCLAAVCLAAVLLVFLGSGAAHGTDYTSADGVRDVTAAEVNAWSGDVSVMADSGPVAITVTGGTLASGSVGTLSVGSSGGEARLAFSAGTVVFDAGAVLTAGGGGTAVLAVTGGNLTIAGTTAIGDNSTVIIDSGSLTAGGFQLVGNNAAMLVSGGAFTASGDSVISNGTLTLNTSGGVDIASLTLDGTDAILNLDSISAGSVLNATILQGTVNVNGAIDLSGGSGAIVNTGGALSIGNAASLTVRDITLGGSDGARADIAGSLNAQTVSLTAGVVTVGGSVAATTFTMTGGSLTVDGVLDATATTFGGGTVAVAMGGLLSGGSVVVDGATVNISGAVADGVSFTANSGTVTVDSFATFGSAGAGLAELNIAGATLELRADANTRSLSFSDGVINVRNGVTLYADAVSGNFSGAMLLDGGVLDVGDSFAMRSAGGRISAGSSGGKISVGNGGSLTVRSGATLDASGGDIELAAAGGLNLQGAYVAGHDGSDVTKVTITGGGGLSVGSSAEVRLSTSLQSLAAATDLENDAILVLMTDAVAGDTLSLEWDSNTTVYYYELRRNPDEGNKWGLYLIGAGDLGEEDRYQRLLERWNENPSVGGRADNLIRPDFGKAISDAARLVAAGGFENIDTTRTFNGRVLNSFINAAEVDTVGYDALMLYNGSGIGLANQAVMDSNAYYMRMLGRRTSLVRNEYMAGQTIGSDMALASGSYETLLPNRAWAALFGQNEQSGSSDGFAGYKYNHHGVAVGYDRLIGGVTVGGSFAYTGGGFDDKAALANDSEISTYAFAIYGGFNHCSGVFVTGALGYSYSDNSIRDYRILNSLPGWNSADYHTNTYMATLSVGYDWQPTEFLTVSPSLGFAYQHSTSAAHSQYFVANDNTASANTINAGRVKNHSASMPLDLAISYDFIGDEDSLLTLTGNIGWAREFHDKGASGSLGYGGLTEIGPVDVVSRKPGKNILNVGVAAKYVYKQFEFTAGYDYLHRKNYDAHSYSAGFGVNF